MKGQLNIYVGRNKGSIIVVWRRDVDVFMKNKYKFVLNDDYD
jgi:hypothetical protein